jgi:hypothetical protein
VIFGQIGRTIGDQTNHILHHVKAVHLQRADSTSFVMALRIISEGFLAVVRANAFTWIMTDSGSCKVMVFTVPA